MRPLFFKAVADRVAYFPFGLRLAWRARAPQKRLSMGRNSGHITWSYVARMGSGGGGGAFHFGPMGAPLGKWLEKSQQVCRNGLATG